MYTEYHVSDVISSVDDIQTKTIINKQMSSLTNVSFLMETIGTITAHSITNRMVDKSSPHKLGVCIQAVC